MNPTPYRTSQGTARRAVRRASALAGCTALALLLGACQALVPDSWHIPSNRNPAPVSARSTEDAVDLFVYTQRLLKMNHEDLVLEIGHRRDRIEANKLPLDRAKLAIALTLPNQGQRDTTRALLAMSEVPRDDPSIGPQGTALVSYVETLLAWQARQEELLQTLVQPEHAAPAAGTGNAPAPPEVANLQALAQKLRADQKRNEAQIEALNGRIRDEKARADALQQKLDALGNLEKSLAERKPARSDTNR